MDVLNSIFVFLDLLAGTNLIERFRDQFKAMLIGENMSSLDSTFIRMPLSSECLKDGVETGFMRVKQIIDRFWEHGSRALIFLKSVLQVQKVLSTLVLLACTCIS